MRTLFHDEELTYDGSQLRSHFAYDLTGAAGDAAVAFVGPCKVVGPALVDLDDRRDGLFIESRRMLHLIVEHFDHDLERAVCRQRLLVARIGELLNETLGELVLRRRGDDLFDGDRKLSVSIATLSPVSALIHTGLNVISEGAPVPARGLADWGLDPRETGERILAAYAEELAGMTHARCKVRGVI